MLKNITKEAFNSWIYNSWDGLKRPNVFAVFDNHEEEAFAIVCYYAVLAGEMSALRVYDENGKMVTEVEFGDV